MCKYKARAGRVSPRVVRSSWLLSSLLKGGMAVCYLASKRGLKRPWSESEDSESDEEDCTPVDWERSVHSLY